MGYTVIGWNRVILSASPVSLAAVAKALKHGCHSQTVGFSFLDKKKKKKRQPDSKVQTFELKPQWPLPTFHLYKGDKVLLGLEEQGQRLLRKEFCSREK